MIYCVWYPSGGFGHFVNAVLTLYGENFVRPKKSLKFSANGNSHDLDLVVPKYFKDYWPSGIEFRHDKNYCVLIDNGINDESTKFKNTFPGASITKICYTDSSWPVVARTMIEKAMKSSMDAELPTDAWNIDEPWVKREKYFLYLRDHPLRHAWKPAFKNGLTDNNLDVGEFYEDYNNFHSVVNAIAKTDDFYDLWKEWQQINIKYIDPVITAKTVLSWLMNKEIEDLSHITDLWTQAVIYYYIWLKYGVEVPHNDYSNWFTNTSDIVKMLKEHGVV